LYSHDSGDEPPDPKTKQKINNAMKKILAPKTRSRLRPLLAVAALFAINTVPAFAQSTTFSSTDLKTGISNSLAVIMMFGFVLGISAVIYGGFARFSPLPPYSHSIPFPLLPKARPLIPPT